jgi:uncharacterized membrane protein
MAQSDEPESGVPPADPATGEVANGAKDVVDAEAPTAIDGAVAAQTAASADPPAPPSTSDEFAATELSPGAAPSAAAAQEPEVTGTSADDDPAAKSARERDAKQRRGRERSEKLASVARCLSLSGLIGLSLTVTVQFMYKASWLTGFILHNQLPMPQRMRMIMSMVIGLAVGALLGAVGMFFARRRGVSYPHIERVFWFLSPLILLPAFPQLYRWKPWKGKHNELLPVLLAVALVAEVLFVKAFSNIPERVGRAWSFLRAKAPGFFKKHGPVIILLSCITAYVLFMSFYNLRWHYKIRTHNFDLAIDDNLISAALEGGHIESTVVVGNNPKAYLGAHAKLGQYVILPIYALYPRVETLIVLQSLCLGLAALPLYAFSRHFLRPWVALAVSLAFLCYFPMHSANFTESKYLSIGCVFLFATYWAALSGRWLWLALFFVCATLMREDVPIGLAIGGTVLILSGKRPIAGFIMALISTIWFVVLRFIIMERAGDWWFPSMYKGLFAPGQTGLGSVAKTLVTNPFFVLDKILIKDKVFYLMHLLVPIIFLPARRWYLWAAFVPGAVLTLLVTDYKPVFGSSFQYVMHWVPYLFLAVPIGLAALEKAGGVPKLRGAVATLAIASTVTTYNYGAFSARTGSVRGGYHYIDFEFTQAERERYAALLDVISVIPPKASVVATEMVGPHVSSRRYMYAMRRGLYGAEYMLASNKELDFESTRKLFTKAVKNGEYGVVKRSADFVVLKAGHDASGNADLIRDWKL